MNIYILIEKNNKQRLTLKRMAKKRKNASELVREHEALLDKKDVLIKHLDIIKELVQMGYNNETFQNHFYSQFMECKDTEFIELLTSGVYNEIDYNNIILETKKEYEKKLLTISKV